MICYLVRHGKDDDSVRGGWSDSPLTGEGIEQAKQLAAKLQAMHKQDIKSIYTSDLPRAKQTALILASALSLPVVEKAEFRETNNGLLAGMPNDLAAKRFPGLYWGALDWEQTYPGGESPAQFYDRIANAWCNFKNELRAEHAVILVTHGGVINAIQCIEQGISYSNKTNPFPIGHAEMVCIET